MVKRFVSSIFLIAIPIVTFGWAGNTHKRITEYSWKNSNKLGISTFLLSLNLEKGIFQENLSDGNDIKSIDEWLQYGAEHEDDKDLALPDRSNYHFHNPLKLWSEAGLSDMVNGSSSILWAQDGPLQVSKSDKQGDRSWNKAREYYYKALTEVEYSVWRENYFAELFKILGHQIHLIQDMAVPDHVRNDAHLLSNLNLLNLANKYANSFRCLEGWAEAKENIGEMTRILSLPVKRPEIDFSAPADPLAPTPIALLSDTKQYKTSQTPFVGLNQGLAEYTNANYFSEDTIFTEDYEKNHKHWFPHPCKFETNLMSLNLPEQITAEDGSIEWVIKHVEKTSGEITNKLVAFSYLISNFGVEQSEYKLNFFLSNECHKKYAERLIPRAVGYSAALLDYFFRGDIEISLPSSTNPAQPRLDGIYGFTDDDSLGFRYISLMAKNITRDNERMTSGLVSLIVSFRKCEGSPFVPNPTIPGTERSFIKIDYPRAVDIPRDDPIRLDFDLSGNPLPVDAVDVNLTLVFHGFLGGEYANAVAIGFKDISEPTPVDLFNNTDLVCFSGSYINYADPELLQQVDTNHNGIIDCDQAEINIIPTEITPLFLSFNGIPASSTNYYYKFSETYPELILPNHTKRFYFLGDDDPAKTRFSVKVKAENYTGSSITWEGVCPTFFDSDQVNAYSYFNKLIWEDDHYKPSQGGIGTLRGNKYYNILIFKNISVPESSTCTFSGLGLTLTVGSPTENHDINRENIPNIIEKDKSKLK
jgi:hypothetical protein